MFAFRAPSVAFSFILLLTLIGGLVPRAADASTALPLPSSMAAVGDSITQAASTGGSLGADAPQNSWSTGTSSTVNSHYLRLQAEGAALSATNLSVSGAKVAGLRAQMDKAVAIKPDYLTVLIGGNDLCTPTVDDMTLPDDFRADFVTAMNTLTTGSSGTNVYVVSIPEVWQLWNLFKNSFWARSVWSSASICQSLLANPTSTQPADELRRQEVRDRNAAYNFILADVCSDYARCRFDNEVVFNTQLAKSDVSGDYFHPSASGQARLSDVSWGAGYAWGTAPTNNPPSASFTFACTGLTCAFTDGSTDSDGTIASRSWAFGDGATSTATNPSRTYAAGGTYTVSLTVTDDDGATGSTSQSVTVTSGTTTISLSVNAYKVKGSQAADLAWSGTTSTNVDIYRDGARVATTANDGAYTDVINKKGGGSYVYKLCEAGTTKCSGNVTASY
jgi:lysophospholipase L1-like esterase